MNKHDFAIIIKVRHGANPNGDPSEENSPRRRADGHGVISDVCLKRKIRDRLADSGNNVFVLGPEKSNDGMTCLSERYKAAGGTVEAALAKYIDVRAFGGVFAYKKAKTAKKEVDDEADDEEQTKSAASQGVRGAITFREATSVEPIDVVVQQITKSTNNEPKEGKGSDTMGKKQHVNGAIYVAYGSINAHTAERNGLTQDDVDKIKKAITAMFCNDDSTSRPSGSMEIHKVIWWEHSKKYGNASSWDVHDSLHVDPNGDYTVKNAFEGVAVSELDKSILD